ncbi:MAG: hypothetical protein M3437_07260 [Chloroflexota bacterium]|nr:hypothetical protein [Chloroflexota bacterium]MDQ5866781.1 hypothetical protein [Chloroflexota bacterium]
MSMSLPGGRYKRLSLVVALSLLLVQATSLSNNASARVEAQATCGAWAIVPTSGTPVEAGRLEGVAATSASNVWVIRTAGEQSDRVARWDGTRWGEEPHPQPGTLFNDFQAIAASPDGDAWIVGAYSSSRVTRPSMAETSTLTARLQGGRWKLVPSPNLPARAQSYLVGVAPIGPDDVLAVGNAGGEDILLRWNGTEWGLVPGPGTAQGGYLFDVAGAASDDAWAVGAHTTDRGHAARILHWDGSRWEQVASPDVASSEYNLQGVAALSATDAWAAGTRSENGRTLTLIEHWDGSDWTVVPSPNTSQPENVLHRVVAAAPDDVWAVGRSGTGGDAQPLMLHWNGSAWNTVALPRVSARFAELVSVEVVPGSGEVWAVGASADQHSHERALAMRYVPCVAGEGSGGGVIPGMPSTGAEGSRTPTVWSIVSFFYDVIGAISALLRH